LIAKTFYIKLAISTTNPSFEMKKVSSNKSFEIIQKSIDLKASFYNAEMLAVLWLTKPDIVKELLPPPSTQ
jgi:hypothetical protein